VLRLAWSIRSAQDLGLTALLQAVGSAAMIFIGDGALMQEAIHVALQRGHHVDRVFGNSEKLAPFCARHSIAFEKSEGLNESPERATTACTDGIAFSIDNALILKPRLLDAPGLSFYGVHSGILPIHRGNPVVALIFALLHGSEEYGVSLFQLDAGIDTGLVFAIRKLRLTPRSRLHEVVVESSMLCHQVFTEYLDRIVSGSLRGERMVVAGTKAHSLRDLAALEGASSHPDFDRATDFGALDGLLPEEHLASLVRLRARARREGPRPRRALDDTSTEVADRGTEAEGLPILGLASRPGPAVRQDPGARAVHSFTLDAISSEEIRELARARETSPLPVLLAGFFALLGHYTGRLDPCASTTVPHPAEGEGSTVVIRADLAGPPSFAELVSQMVGACATAADLRMPLPGAHRGLGFQLRTSQVEENDLPPCEQSWILRDEGGRFQGTIDYDTGRADEVSIARLAAHYAFLLEQMLARPDTSVSELQLITPAEQTTLHEWNQTRGDYGIDRCVHGLFEERAAATPGATAVVGGDGTAVSYREVDLRSTQLARHLAAVGAGPGSLVGICVDRGLEMVVGLLGILKAGAAVVPVDPNYPPERAAFILEDSRVGILVTQTTLERELPRGSWTRVYLDRLVAPALPASEPAGLTSAGPRDLAYVIYTSGSTGRPKGVLVEHRSITNAFLATQRAHGMRPGDRLLGLAAFGSDTAFWQLLAPLSFGATVVLASGTADPAAILESVVRHAVTVIDLVPSLLEAVVEEQERRPRSLPSLVAVISGGEALTQALLDRAAQVLPQVAIYNSYGPTETSCQVTFHRCRRGQPVSIGKPLANTRIYILNARDKPVPVGVVGEITIGGSGVARGYLDRPELTEARFVPDPFSPEPGARMYRTGDLGRYLEGGEIEYVGRTDQQIKINGVRVELGEIEGALRQQPGVRDALVVVEGEASGGRRLVGYVLVGAEPAIAPTELRRQLRNQLPSYVVPAVVVPVHAWPLTPHGKIDRAALPRPSGAPAPPEGGGAPRSDVERRLSHTWAALLGVEHVGIHDDFFALGGHSLLALRLIAEIRRDFGKELTLRSMFQLPTVAQMADFLTADGLLPVPRSRPTREELVRDARLPVDVVAPAPHLGEVFLTGATGFLGRHLLVTLLERSSARVHCLVRAASSDEASARIAEALARAGAPAGSIARVSAVHGDLTRPGFGLAEGDLDALAERVDAVFHLGAAVNHVAPYASLFDANAKGTLEVLRFATRKRTKLVYFASTLDVVGRAQRAHATVPLLCGDPPDDAEPYTLTKWVADQLVAGASARGVPVCILRTGYIGPHSRTGDANAAGWFEVYLRTVLELRSIPADFPAVGITPVDALASRIFDLVCRPESLHQAFHLVRDEQEVTRDAVVALAERLGRPIETVSTVAWRRRLAEHCDAHPGDPAALLGPYLDAVGGHVHQRAADPKAREDRLGEGSLEEVLAAFVTASRKVSRRSSTPHVASASTPHDR